MGVTKIQWTDRSVNPIRARFNGHVGHHCVKVGAGCQFCYASRLQARFKMPGFRADQRQGVEVFFDETRLQEVLRRRIPTKWFWCDMTDMFGDWVEDARLDQMFAVMALTPQHTHQVLTKRPERMRAYLSDPDRPAQIDAAVLAMMTVLPVSGGFKCLVQPSVPGGVEDWPLPNVWVGTSVENQDTYHARIRQLALTPAAVRFLSLEPLLGPIDLRMGGMSMPDYSAHNPLPQVDWVIVGGESGPKARSCHVSWIESVRDQCRDAGVACFIKQLGSDPRWPDASAVPIEPARGKCDDPVEWPEALRVQQFPAVAS